MSAYFSSSFVLNLIIFLQFIIPSMQLYVIFIYLFIGDSTCRRQAHGIRKLHICSIYSAETCIQQVPEVNYWSNNNNNSHIKNVKTHGRDCGGCESFKATCPSFGTFEFITMEFFVDTEITVGRHSHNIVCPITTTTTATAGNTGATQSLITQEFIFNEYIQIFPDIIYHMSTGVHDISRYKSHQFKRITEWYFTLISEFRIRCPNTKDYYSNNIRIAEVHVPIECKDITTNNIILQYNTIVNSSLPTYIIPGLDQWAYSVRLGLG